MTTNVLWAGNIQGQQVVSIFNNTTEDQGNNNPLLNRYDYLDRVYFDSRFDYLNILYQIF